jgi:hypothetical protein
VGSDLEERSGNDMKKNVRKIRNLHRTLLLERDRKWGENNPIPPLKVCVA